MHRLDHPLLGDRVMALLQVADHRGVLGAGAQKDADQPDDCPIDG